MATFLNIRVNLYNEIVLQSSEVTQWNVYKMGNGGSNVSLPQS